ncbi:MAG: nadE [Micavibrio sp.]|nr:nadE [Micavibrio sp.]
MTNKLHISLAQLNPIVGDIAGNIVMAKNALAKVPSNTELVVFPELFVTGYPPEDLVLKPSFMQAVEDAVHGFALQSGAMHVLLPCPWRHNGKTYNAVHLIGDGKIQATRFKYNLPNYGVFDEQRIFESGPLPAPIPFRGNTLGVMICEDCWFPDVALALKNGGADCLIVVNASPFETGKLERRLEVAKARIRETGLPLIYVNAVGGQDEIVFDGASFILNQNGDSILRVGEFEPDLVHTVWEKTPTGGWLCGTGEIKLHREGPALIYQAVMLGLRDYVTKNGFPGIVLGMSGGIDSAISAAIATDALGPDAVHCVMMPSKYTSQDSLDDAAECSAALGVSHDSVSITDIVTSFEMELSHHFTPVTPDITHQNIQSRARGVILMALSNSSGRMVLSTGNKSEMATGYATLYGDMCGGFNVLKDIYKTDVYKMAAWRNAHRPEGSFGPAGPVIPERIMTKAPTAELKPGQKDQDSLPPYDELDAVLSGLIEKDLDPAGLDALGFNIETAKRVQGMVDRAEYKRRQSAPGVKITPRAFGRERRYPITNGYKG